MSRLKKFWILFFSFLPFGAGAAMPWLLGLGAGIGVIAGFSVYRSFVPVNMADALSFFSSCWSCQMFSDVMATMSGLLPRVYKSIGLTTIPIAVALTAVWIAWRLLSGYIGANKPDEGWNLAARFGTHVAKLGVVVALLAFPLPRLIADAIVEPVFNIGFTLGRSINTDFQAGTENESNSFEVCLVATAVADPAAASGAAARNGAFSPKLRHNLSCQLAGIHQMTALGMTTGWTMLNMAFSAKYMHKLMWYVPILPNIPLFFVGMAILVLFFFALLPVPLYMLQVFMELALDLIMLPLFLLSWLFSDWEILKTTSLKTTIDNLIKNVAGIAMVGIFIAFATIFMGAMFGSFDGTETLAAAFRDNNPEALMDGLLMNNNSLITIVLLGLFLAMFMTMIPALVKSMFANASIPDKYYESASKDAKAVWGNVKKWYAGLKK
jgi:hypothetical protein